MQRLWKNILKFFLRPYLCCMERKELTPGEAVLLLCDNVKLTPELYEAKYAAQGKRQYPVGMERAVRLAKQYDPDGLILCVEQRILKVEPNSET